LSPTLSRSLNYVTEMGCTCDVKSVLTGSLRGKRPQWLKIKVKLSPSTGLGGLYGYEILKARNRP
jgi:hypothetical protein